MRVVYSGQRDGRITKWSVDSHQAIKNFDMGHSEWISQILIDKSEKRLYSAGGDS